MVICLIILFEAQIKQGSNHLVRLNFRKSNGHAVFCYKKLAFVFKLEYKTTFTEFISETKHFCLALLYTDNCNIHNQLSKLLSAAYLS